MVFPKMITRFFHVAHATCFATAEKSLLGTLRKKTGYTFSNCKKALEMHHNDMTQAEKWLKEQAQVMGWSKATKLEGRQTTQGLIGVCVEDNNAALVEVNCETDFVARNREFQRIVELATKSCLKYTKEHHSTDSPVTKIGLDVEQIKKLRDPEGKLLADQVALMIGSVGENASVRRAFCVKVTNKLILAGYAHPSGTQNENIQFGKFGGLVVLKQITPNTATTDLEKLAKNLCQHVVGMNPKKIGSETDKPATNKEDEECLIYQEYLLEEGVSVGEILEENGVQVVDFKRFECGECSNINIDYIETCQ